jgi:hypothetical protein
MRRRAAIILISGAIGVLFAAGLFFHGRTGGGLLLITDAVLISLLLTAWANVRPEGRPVRIGVIMVIATVAVIKLIRGG